MTPKPDIFRHSQRRALRNPLVRSGERRVRPDDLMGLGSILATTPLRTACDLGRLFHRDVALWGLDSMLSTGAFGLDELLAELPAFGRGSAEWSSSESSLRLLTPDRRASVSPACACAGTTRPCRGRSAKCRSTQVGGSSTGSTSASRRGFAAEYDGPRHGTASRGRSTTTGADCGWMRSATGPSKCSGAPTSSAKGNRPTSGCVGPSRVSPFTAERLAGSTCVRSTSVRSTSVRSTCGCSTT